MNYELYDCPICGQSNIIDYYNKYSIGYYNEKKYWRQDCIDCSLVFSIYEDEFVINYNVNYKFFISHAYHAKYDQYLHKIDCYSSGRTLIPYFKCPLIEFPFTEEYIESLLILS